MDEATCSDLKLATRAVCDTTLSFLPQSCRHGHCPQVSDKSCKRHVQATSSRHDKPVVGGNSVTIGSALSLARAVSTSTALRLATGAEHDTPCSTSKPRCLCQHCTQIGDWGCIRHDRRVIETTLSPSALHFGSTRLCTDNWRRDSQYGKS